VKLPTSPGGEHSGPSGTDRQAVAPDALARRLAAGHAVTHAEAAGGGWFADLRDPAGRLAETGLGNTQAEALASLRDRLGRSEPGAAFPAGGGQDDGPLAALDRADRIDFINVMTADEAKMLLAHIAGYAPRVFDAAVTDRSETFADELFGRIEARDDAEYQAEPEGYCTVCGENVAHFFGYEGPQHFRGPHKLVTGGERRELFDAGHEPVIAWREAGAR
jgi:hypothetical protein